MRNVSVSIFHSCHVVLVLNNLTLDPLSILRFPLLKSYIPDDSLCRKIARYFATVLDLGNMTQTAKYKMVLKQLPSIMPRWGKVRIGNRGDSIRCWVASGASHIGSAQRNSSFVRVSVNMCQVSASECFSPLSMSNTSIAMLVRSMQMRI
jgi:hypothetical protein